MSSYLFVCSIACVLLGSELIRRFVLSPPKSLSHLPRAPLVPLLKSYFSGEVEEQRVKNVLLPFAKSIDSDILLVWAFGLWIVHILEHKTAKKAMEDRSYLKQAPPKEMAFWKFTGLANIFFLEGSKYQTHSNAVKSALKLTPPIDLFVSLSHKVIDMIGEGGRVRWNDYTQRFTLDAVGAAVLGYDFNALENPDSPFVKGYHDIMTAIAKPAYIFLPALEVWLPRHELNGRIDNFRAEFSKLISQKRKALGDDIVSYMLQEPAFSEEEILDNVVSLFMAGHDTTAGALSTLICFFAQFPSIQKRARSEVLSVLTHKDQLSDPDFHSLSQMVYLTACIRESMRLNNPSTMIIPRVSDTPTTIGKWGIPPQTPVVVSICGVLNNADSWSNPQVYDPERFMSDSDGDTSAWTPFGVGSRQCPARNFSLFEQRTLAAMLLRDFEWSLPADSIHSKGGIKNAFSPFALSLPFNMDIIFTRRR